MLSRLLRWEVGILLFLIGTLLWFGALLAYPYTTYGWTHERVRPNVAEWSINLAASSIAVLLLCSLVLFNEIKRLKLGWRILFAGFVLFFVSIDIYRIVWIEFAVLPQAGHQSRD